MLARFMKRDRRFKRFRGRARGGTFQHPPRRRLCRSARRGRYLQRLSARVPAAVPVRSWFRCATLAVLLGIAAFAIVPRSASAAVCDGDTAHGFAIWTACLTVGKDSGGEPYGYDGTTGSEYGSLSDTDFTVADTDFEVNSLKFIPGTGLRLDVEASSSNVDTSSWVLQIGTTANSLGSRQDPYTWSSPGFSWNDADIGEQVSVSLRVGSPADELPPEVKSAAVTSKDLALTFSEHLNRASVPSADRFTVKVNGATRTVSEVSVEGVAVTLTLAVATVAGERVTLSYDRPHLSTIDRFRGRPLLALQDGSGNPVDSFTDLAVTNESPACPAGQPASNFWEACLTVGLSAGFGYYGQGDNPRLNFGMLSDTTTDQGWRIATLRYLSLFGLVLSFTNNDHAVSKNATLQIGSETFKLADATYHADGRVYQWKPTTFAWDRNNVGDAVSVSLVAGSVDVAPEVRTATVNGASLELVFDEALNTGSVPAKGAFEVQVSGSDRALASSNAVAVSGRTVTLTLASAAKYGQVVSVTYTKPVSNPLEDGAGTDVDGFSVRAVNETPLRGLRSLVFDPARVTVEEAATATYTVKLDRAPEADRPVRVTVKEYEKFGRQYRQRRYSRLEISPSSFTLDVNNWDSGQEVTLRARYDDNGELDRATVAHGGGLVEGSFHSDSVGSALVEVTIPDVNERPKRENDIPTQEAIVGQAFSYTFPENIFSDPDGDPLSYSALQFSGSALPSWLAFDGPTRTFSGTPKRSDPWYLWIFVRASDGFRHQPPHAQEFFSLRLYDSLDAQLESRWLRSGRERSSWSRSRSLAQTPSGVCRVEVAVRFVDAEGETVEVAGLTADDFAVENGRLGTPARRGDGWRVEASSDLGFTGLMRVRLLAKDLAPIPEPEDAEDSEAVLSQADSQTWAEQEQVFRVSRGGDCAAVAPGDLAALALDGLTLAPSFSAATTAYTAQAAADQAQTTVTAAAVYGTAAVAIAPADADAKAEGHQVALAAGETAVTVTVTPGDGSAAKSYTIAVTRAADTTVRASGPATQVPAGWSLIPSGLSPGDRFRLLAVTSTTRHAKPKGTRFYNRHVQRAVASGHADIKDHSAAFRMLGCTSDVEARVNTGTAYTSTDKGVPVYWLGGAKVADDYADLYDGSWASHAPRDESGAPSSHTKVFTGCNSDGTAGAPLGGRWVGVGYPGTSGRELHHGGRTLHSLRRPLYGLSPVFAVAPAAPGAPTVTAAAGDGQVALTWTAPAYDGTLTGWQVRHGAYDAGTDTVDWGKWTAIEDATAETTAHTVTGLTNGTAYRFELRALAGAVVGTASATVPGTPGARNALTSLTLDGLTLAPAFEAATTAYTAAAPADQAQATVTATAVYGASAVAIAPGDADTEAEGHQVALAEGETAVTVTVTPGDGSAAQTYTVTVTRAAAPSAPAVTAKAGDGEVALSWTAPAYDGTLTGWQVRHGAYAAATDTVDWGDWAAIEDATAETTLHTVTGLTNGTAYEFELRAVAGAVPGAAAAVSATPVAPDPDATRAGAASLGAQAPSKGRQFFTGKSLDRANGDAVDYYTFTTDGRYELGLGVRDQSIELQVVLEDERGTAVGTAGPPFNPNKDQVYIEWLKTVIDAGTYYVRVEALADGATDYYIRFGLTPPPPQLAVADARAEEGTDATLDFVVSLDRAPTKTVTVAYATADGTATAGADYTATSGTLTFAPGEQTKTIAVPVLDDVHDEGEETLTLTLSSAAGAGIAAGTATGTIANSDPLQQAWLARFGRTAATHVTDAVGERLRGAPGQASHLTIGGYRVPLERPGRVPSPQPSPPSRGEGARGGREPAPDLSRGPGEGAEAERALAAKLWGPLTPDEHAEPPGRLAALVTGVAEILGLGSAGPGDATTDSPWLTGPGLDPRLGQSRSLTFDLRQILLGSAFRLNLNGTEADTASPRLTAWGRFAGTTFNGQDGALALNGDVFTGTVGVDSEWDRLLAGVAVAHSRGDGSFSDATPGLADRGQGGLEQTLTSLHPYLRYAVTDRLDVWGLVGYGWGELDVALANGTTLETDTTLLMGAFGGRGLVLAPADAGGFQLATRTDAMLTQTSADAAANSAATDADAHRVRVILEGSRGVTWDGGRRLTPTVEVGLRHDWGDAETGFGLELGGRVQYADPGLGLTVEGAVRGLLAHEDADYQEWGASGNIRLAPGAGGQGLSLTVSPTWGAAASGVEGLWSRQTTQGLAPQGRTQAPGGRLAAEVGYGFAAFDVGLVTPYAGTVLAEGADRTYRVGTRLQVTGRWATGLTLNVEGTRQEPTGPQPVNQGVQVQATWGF